VAADALPPEGRQLRVVLQGPADGDVERQPRRQHGISAAAVVIARTYPFNPTWEQRVRHVTGPGVINHIPVESILLQELEVRGQGRYRRQEAGAALTRTDWEIATQELTLAVRTTRAFYTLLYRQEKLRLVREAIALNQEALERLQQAVNLGASRFRPDVIVLRTEVDDARSQVGLGLTALETARYDLYRALGVAGAAFELDGGLETAPPQPDPALVLEAARQRRPDLYSHRAAVAEAQAALRLEVANRYGNPTFGPNWEINETSDNFVGGQFTLPLPVWNTHRGEIQQRQAQVGRAALELRQTQVAVEQDVQAALARLDTARRSAEFYRNQVIPNVRRSLSDLEALFRANDPNMPVDMLRVLDVRRKLIRAQDGYLDSLLELTQAWADLAAAIGDPGLLLPPCPPPPEALPAPAPAPQARLLDARPAPDEPDVLALPTIELRPCAADGPPPRPATLPPP
jgi:cobalt-zinc-cadmium efflux system outer membrane protein